MRANCALWQTLLMGAFLAGCYSSGGTASVANSPAAMLPEQIRIHPFTGVRTIDKQNSVSAIDARIEVLDHFGDSTKAFGTFRFELFAYRAHESDPRGQRLAVWSENIENPNTNFSRWDSISRTYKFRLVSDKPILPSQRFVLVSVFSNPYGPRLFDQRVFVSGE